MSILKDTRFSSAVCAKIGSIVVPIAIFVLGVTVPGTKWIDENQAV
jgi:hypothetical protein